MSSNIPSFLRNEYLNLSPVSLWNARHDNGQEYFNIEIYSDEHYVEKDIDGVLNMNTYKCHICNLDIPKTYIEEHISSAKHKTCLKIADIALERIQLHMKSNLIQPRRKLEVVDTYFCSHCTTVVQNIEKDNHILTNKHVNSVKIDDLLQRLVKIYEEPTEDYDFANKFVKDIEVHKLIDALAISKDKIEADSTNNTNIKENKEMETNDPKTEAVCDSKMTVNQQKLQMNNKANKNIGKVINDHVIAKAKNKKKKKSKEVNFYVNTNNQERKTDKQNDTTSEEQSERNQQPCGSTSKIEKLSNAKESTSNIEKVSSSKESTSNIEKLSNAKENTSNIEKVSSAKESTSKIDKEPCAKESTSNYSENLQDLKHYLEIASFLHTGTVNVTAHSEDVVVISGPKTKKVKVPLVNFHGFSVTGKDVVCKICLDKNSVDGRKHKWSESHMKKVMSPLKEGHCRQGDTLDHCILCNNLHFTSQIADHITSVEHVNNLQKYAVYKQFISKKVAQLAVTNFMRWTKDTMICKICEIQLEKMDSSILQHTKSEEHIRKYDFVFTVNKFTNVPSKNGSCLCLVCQEEIWAGHVLDHCKSPRHKKKLAMFVDWENKND